MWTASTEELVGSRGQRITIAHDDEPATISDVLLAWQAAPSFRRFFNQLLADAPYGAFRWETPAVTAAALVQSFEFVMLDSPGLARAPEEAAFAEHFAATDAGVCVFANLGRDAVLIVPRPLTEAVAYGHLAAFVRLAPEPQRHELWHAVGAAMMRRVSDKPVWLSTAGAGVSWLHVRLDDRPKYYGYAPYRRLPM